MRRLTDDEGHTAVPDVDEIRGNDVISQADGLAFDRFQAGDIVQIEICVLAGIRIKKDILGSVKGNEAPLPDILRGILLESDIPYERGLAVLKRIESHFCV